MNELIFPPEAALKIEDIRKVDRQIDIYVRSQQNEASCPACQTVSNYVHGRYWRHPQDLPWVGLSVQLHLEVRRFACRDEKCFRKTFAEGLTELVAPRARRTSRLKEQHLATAQALGLSLPVSRVS